ncbi:MAG: putative molybdopterin biosynthesis protein [Cellvibrionaceae bacterium]|jgi:putative molybdopterin biosynthesis protein
MSIYLHDIPLQQAQDALKQALKAAGLDGVLGSQELLLDEYAVGRITAVPVWAKMSSPHYHASAMDGFAVRAYETDGALLTQPKNLLYHSQTQYVDTGDPLPEWANGVIKIEDTEPIGVDGQLSAERREPHAIRIREAIPPWRNVRPMGEDMVATQLVLPAGHVIRPVDLGAMAGSGHTTVTVAKWPKVAVLPTGTELKAIGEPVKAGDIIEYNSLVLAGQVNQWGGQATRYPITTDIFEEIQQAVRDAAASHDLILLNAGSSAGAEDFSAGVIESLGTLLVHGVAVRPGHPVIIGMIPNGAGQNIPIIGVPGYPVSAALTGEIFVEPMLARWLGRRSAEPLEIEAELTRKHVSPLGDDEYARMVVGRVGDRVLAAPLSRGAGVISSLVRADGITIFPAGNQGQAAGSKVNVRMYTSRSAVDRTIFGIGSHDMILDLLAQFLSGRERRLTSANVGSLGGLVALRRGESHLAGSHLLDPATGEYNVADVAKYLPDTPVKIVTLVGREQGLIVPVGNPKQIKSLADLVQPGVEYVNRQRGAGTRVLFDYQLEQAGLDQADVTGYGREEYTHLAVAAAIAGGRGDCGLGITAAARALELDFVPLFQERYDLIIPLEYAESDLLAPLFDLLNDDNFKAEVARLPGYDVGPMGNEVAV